MNAVGGEADTRGRCSQSSKTAPIPQFPSQIQGVTRTPLMRSKDLAPDRRHSSFMMRTTMRITMHSK
jgi:hypothetical protein